MQFKTQIFFTILYCTIVSGARIERKGKNDEVLGKSSERKAGKWATLSGEPTQLMGHRGEKTFMPEHTVGSYELAAIEGADYVEPDLTLTKDGHIVCFHDLTLKVGTNVGDLEKFRDKMIANFTGVIDEDAGNITILNDWFIKDFTLEELKELKVVQKNIGIRPQLFNDLFTIPTFDEYLRNIHHNAHRLNKSVGIIPELKHPMFHNLLFNATPYFMEDLVLSTLSTWGYPIMDGTPESCISPQDNGTPIRCGHVILQSFELGCVKYLAQKTNMDRMMLIDVQLTYMTYQGLEQIAPYATHYSVGKELLYVGIETKLERDGTEYDKELIDGMGGFIPPQDIVGEAHKLGLQTGIYTIYDSREPSGRGCWRGCDPENKEVELFYYFEMGVDGMFVENVQEARELRLAFQLRVIDAKNNDDTTGGSTTLGQGIFKLLILGLMIVWKM